MFKLIEKHLKRKENDDEISIRFKQSVIEQLTERFKLNEPISPNIISARHIAPFFNPRYKKLDTRQPKLEKKYFRKSPNII